MRVLAIESSCDETAVAVVEWRADRVVVLSDIVHSQAVHARYGGVVPEIASRAHIEQVVPTVRAALTAAGVARPEVVAATAGPGLLGAVLVGMCFGKGLAEGWGVPFYGVNHLEGHLLSALLEARAPAFPFLSLVISGGHTTLYEARAVGDYRVLAETTDDAAGECFDKVARMLNLGYPGGAKIDALAQTGRSDAFRLPMPRPLGREGDWSFSGIKSFVRQQLDKHPDLAPADVAAAFQAGVARYIVDRVLSAAGATGIQRVAIGGGAAANEGIRAALLASGLDIYMPPKRRCTDNAAMIGNVAALRLKSGAEPWPAGATARARWSPVE